MKTSEKIDLISKAIVESQKEINAAIKASKNPFFKSSYADLTAVIDAVKEPLNKHGIAFLQLVHSDEVDTVETILLHESGQYIATDTRVYCTKPNDPQAFGSGITYTKRYALQAALGLPTEDDDGNSAAGKAAKQDPEPETSWTPKQIEFAEKLKIALNDTEQGKGVQFELVKKYLIWHYKQATPPRPVTEDDSVIPGLVQFLVKKPTVLNQLKGDNK